MQTKQALREKKTKRQREKGGNSSVVHLADDILCTLSVISFSSTRMDRISPLSVSLPLSLGWLLYLSPWRHLSPLSLALFLSLPLFSVAAVLLKLYELVTTLFSFLTSSLTFSSQTGREFNTCLETNCPSLCPSVCLPLPTFLFLFFPLNSCLAKKLPGKNTRWNWKKKII